MRPGRLLAVVLVVAAPLVAAAADAPHENGGGLCENCHLGHNATTGSLTKGTGNFNLCQSCHWNQSPTVQWSEADQAVPGESGISHRWDAPAAGMGATAPPPPMGGHLDGGSLKCTTCHDTHQADALLGSPADPANLGRQHTSYPVDVPQPPRSLAAGQTLTLLSPVAPAATPKSYLVEIFEAGSASNATFRLSNDNGASWLGCVTQNDYTYVTFAANPCKVGASVPLNDGTNVNVTFAGTFGAGERWSFFVSYPFLRVANKDGAMCTTCHQDRNMAWQDVEGGDANGVPGGRKTVALGTTVFHHPVGQALRSPPAGGILDASGVVQTVGNGDGNEKNDLTFGTGGMVTCMTCHRPHNAYSNSLTEDLQ